MDRVSDAISIVPCGMVSQIDLELLAREFGQLLSVRAEVIAPLDLPAETYNPQRNQYNAAMVLDYLASRHPNSSRIIGITSLDLFLPIFTHVYGEAQMPGRAAVVSLFRLGSADPDHGSQTFQRALKVTVHELLHTYEVTHCHHPDCLMQPVTRIDQLDRLPLKLCRSCKNLWKNAILKTGQE